MRIRVLTMAGICLGALLVVGPASRADDRDLAGKFAKGSDIIGKKVVNSQGDKLGDIQDFALDSNGRIAYGILSFGGFLGLGEKQFAVPWSALHRRGDTFVLDIDKDKLKNAQGFDKDKWPDLANREWGRQISEFYGVRPYWENNTATEQAGAVASEANLRREALDFPLNFQEGKSLHYTINVKPSHPGGISSTGIGTRREDSDRETNRLDPVGGRTAATDAAQECRHETWVKTTKVSGDEATFEVTFDGSKCAMCTAKHTAGGKTPDPSMMKSTYTARVSKDGNLLALDHQSGGSQDASERAGWESIFRNHFQQLLGYGLHDRKLEPGKVYEAAWLKKGAFSPQGTGHETSETAGQKMMEMPPINCVLRYEGWTDVGGQRQVHFAVLPASGSFSGADTGTGNRTDRSSQPREEGQNRDARSADTERYVGGAASSGRNLGVVLYRVDDGCLEKFHFMPSTVLSGDRERNAREGHAWEVMIRRAE